MPIFQLPPRLKEKIKSRPTRPGMYGAPPKVTIHTPAFGKPAQEGALIPGVRELPKSGVAAAKAIPKPVSSPIPIPQAKLGVPSRFIIEGKRASDLEWRVWRMLLKLGWPQEEIDFQTDILGGHMPGGAILDFVVWTPGMVTIIEPNGDYWHIHTPEQQERDRVRLEKIRHAYSRPFTYIPLASGDLQTDDQAYHNLLLAVGRY